MSSVKFVSIFLFFSSKKVPSRKCFSMWPKVEGKLKPVFDSDVRSDTAVRDVLTCLRSLATEIHPEEVMMVITNLNFQNYLCKLTPDLKCVFIRPDDCSEGDFDILIIHRKYGLIVAEIKSVGANLADLQKSRTEKDHKVADKLLQAIEQLNKAKEVLKHLVKDMPHVHITSALMLPRIEFRELSSVLSQKDDLTQVKIQTALM